jgi:hypothetical protein
LANAMPLTPILRLARAAAFTAVCLGLGMAAHLFAGGTIPPAAVARGTVVVFALAVPVSGRERTIGTILPLLATAQVALHLLFSSAHTHPHLVTAGHVHSGLGPGPGMLLMHGWAAVLTSLWLARGEAALWALLRRLAVRLIRLAAEQPDPLFTTLFSPPTGEPVIPRSVVPRHAVTRRGPPWNLSAAA